MERSDRNFNLSIHPASNLRTDYTYSYTTIKQAAEVVQTRNFLQFWGIDLFCYL